MLHRMKKIIGRDLEGNSCSLFKGELQHFIALLFNLRITCSRQNYSLYLGHIVKATERFFTDGVCLLTRGRWDRNW
jgi:hypothetical protein